MHVKQVRDKFSAQCKGNSGSVCFDFNPFLKTVGVGSEEECFL